MSNMTPQVVANLGALHRAGVWENIALVVGLSAKGINVAQSLTLSMDTSPEQSTVNLDDLDASTSPGGTNGVQSASTNTASRPPARYKEYSCTVCRDLVVVRSVEV